jgi:hypothetical protein
MQDRLIYVAQRAYELARSGEYSDLASVEKAIVAEGFADGVAWLERPDVKDSLQVICRHSQERRSARGVGHQHSAENGIGGIRRSPLGPVPARDPWAALKPPCVAASR